MINLARFWWFFFTQVAKRKMEMLFVRGDGVILVRFFLLYLLRSFIDKRLLIKRYHHHREHNFFGTTRFCPRFSHSWSSLFHRIKISVRIYAIRFGPSPDWHVFQHLLESLRQCNLNNNNRHLLWTLNDSVSDDPFQTTQATPMIMMTPNLLTSLSKDPLLSTITTLPSPLKTSPISTLPTEILIHILKNLNREDLRSCVLVSRHWYECAVERLWYRYTLCFRHDTMTRAYLLCRQNKTFTHFRYIRQLNIHAYISDDIFSTFSRCENLENLKLSCCEHLTG